MKKYEHCPVPSLCTWCGQKSKVLGGNHTVWVEIASFGWESQALVVNDKLWVAITCARSHSIAFDGILLNYVNCTGKST